MKPYYYCGEGSQLYGLITSGCEEADGQLCLFNNTLEHATVSKP
jgi:hypothetical protein